MQTHANIPTYIHNTYTHTHTQTHTNIPTYIYKHTCVIASHTHTYIHRDLPFRDTFLSSVSLIIFTWSIYPSPRSRGFRAKLRRCENWHGLQGASPSSLFLICPPPPPKFSLFISIWTCRSFMQTPHLYHTRWKPLRRLLRFPTSHQCLFFNFFF